MEIFINEKGENYNSFIYKWIDIKLNKFYIGSHCGSTDDGYLFGGIDIKAEYKKRPSDFKRDIISYHIISDYVEIREIEKSYLIKYDVENDDNFYNRTNESYGGYHRKSIERRLNDIDENGLNHFQRASKKMVRTRMRKGNYKTAKIKEYITKKDKLDEIKNKISKSLIGSKWVNKDGISRYVKREEYDQHIKDGWVNGISHGISYDDCKKIAKENNIKSAAQWFKYAKNVSNVPSHPERKYDEWINWKEFLSK